MDLGFTAELKDHDSSPLLCPLLAHVLLSIERLVGVILTPPPSHSVTSCASADTDTLPLDSSDLCQMPTFQDGAKCELKPCCPVLGGHSVSGGYGRCMTLPRSGLWMPSDWLPRLQGRTHTAPQPPAEVTQPPPEAPAILKGS